jgi:hypothetical protein
MLAATATGAVFSPQHFDFSAQQRHKHSIRLCFADEPHAARGILKDRIDAAELISR